MKYTQYAQSVDSAVVFSASAFQYTEFLIEASRFNFKQRS